MRTLRLLALLLALAPAAARAQDAAAPAPAAPAAPPPAPPAVAPPPPQAVQVAPAPQAAPSAPAPQPAAPPVAPPPSPPPQPAYPAPVYPAPATPAYPAPAYPQPSYAPQPAPQAPPAAVYVPPSGYPALPPGYTYAPVPQVPTPAEAARRDQLYSELLRVDTRIAELDRTRVGLGGPIAMMGFGYGALLFSSAVALSAYAAAEAVERGDYYYDDEDDHYHHHDHDGRYHADDLDANNDGYVDHRDERRYRKLAYGFTGVAAVGLTAGIIGTVRLKKRIAERRQQGAERKRLVNERENLRKQLDYGVGVMPQSLQLNIQGHF